MLSNENVRSIVAVFNGRFGRLAGTEHRQCLAHSNAAFDAPPSISILRILLK